MWAAKFNFENAFKPVSYGQWEAFKGDNIYHTHNHRHHQCGNPCRRHLRRSPWEDDRHDSFLGHIVPIQISPRNKCGHTDKCGHTTQRFPFTSSFTCIQCLPTRHRKFSESNCNPVVLTRRGSHCCNADVAKGKPPETKEKSTETSKKPVFAQGPIKYSDIAKNIPVPFCAKCDPPKLVNQCKTPCKKNNKIVAPFKISPPEKAAVVESKPKVIVKAPPPKAQPIQKITPPTKKESPVKVSVKPKPSLKPKSVPSPKKGPIELKNVSKDMKVLESTDSSKKAPTPEKKIIPVVIPAKRKTNPKILPLLPTIKESEPKVPSPKKELEPNDVKKPPRKVPTPKKESEPKAPPPKKMSEPKAIESPVASPSLGTGSSSLESSNSSEKPNNLEAEEAFQVLKLRQPPVVFVYGQPVVAAKVAREHYIQSYADKYNAFPIMLDNKMEEWSHLPSPEKNPAIIKKKMSDKSWQEEQKRLNLIKYAIEISSRLAKDPKSTLTKKETLEIIKYAMIDSPKLEGGFIIDGFPGCVEEALIYQPYFWPFVAGLQFLCSEEKEKLVSTPPKYFRREFQYTEKDIGYLGNQFGSKSIRVFGDAEWGQNDDDYMNSMLGLYLDSHGTIPFSKTREKIPQKKKGSRDRESFVGVLGPSISEINALKEELSKGPGMDDKGQAKKN